jgi:uncharacterized protein YkwD
VNLHTTGSVVGLYSMRLSRRKRNDSWHDLASVLHPIDAMPCLRTVRARGLLTLSALLLAGGGAVASAQCGSAPSPDEALYRLNAERARGAVCHGSAAPRITAALHWNNGLAAVAAAQADDMVALKHMGHRDALNRPLASRLRAMGYRFSLAVENVAVGYGSLDTVVDAWLASDAHCANLMNAAVLELGLACSDGDGGEAERYWTLVLGAPQRR